MDGTATKLENLSVTSVDLVDQGANPDAHVRLFKRNEGQPPQEPQEGADPEKGLFQKFLAWFSKGLQDAMHPQESPAESPAAAEDGGEAEVQKEAQTFGQNLSREELKHIGGEMHDFCYALADSLTSIICDSALNPESRKSLMTQSLEEFTGTMSAAMDAWAAGRRMETPTEVPAGIQKSTGQQESLKKLLEQHDLGETPADPAETEPQSGENEKEESDTMRIDKSKMTPEEKATLADLEKRYGVADDGEAGAALEQAAPDSGGVAKGAENTPPAPAPQGSTDTGLHPEVAKQLAAFQEANQKQTAEIAALRKSLEMEQLTAVAKKYEVLGQNATELASKLYDLKKAGGTIFTDYMALLDANLAAVTKGGLFGEIGSNREGRAGTEQTLLISAAELQKSATGGLSSPEAVIKAFEDNPEMAAQYEAEYRGVRG